MIDSANRGSGVPLAAHEPVVIDFVRQVSLRNALDHRFVLTSGDIQVVSDHGVFRSRKNFIDHDDPGLDGPRNPLVQSWAAAAARVGQVPDTALHCFTKAPGCCDIVAGHSCVALLQGACSAPWACHSHFRGVYRSCPTQRTLP
jgi:hypothetical protein